MRLPLRSPDTATLSPLSFFPCLPYEEHPRGFVRPTIRIPDVISGAKCIRFKKNEQTNRSAVKNLWGQVLRQVTDQGLMLGISAALPPAASAATTNAIAMDLLA